MAARWLIAALATTFSIFGVSALYAQSDKQPETKMTTPARPTTENLPGYGGKDEGVRARDAATARSS